MSSLALLTLLTVTPSALLLLSALRLQRRGRLNEILGARPRFGCAYQKVSVDEQRLRRRPNVIVSPDRQRQALDTAFRPTSQKNSNSPSLTSRLRAIPAMDSLTALASCIPQTVRLPAPESYPSGVCESRGVGLSGAVARLVVVLLVTRQPSGGACTAAPVWCPLLA